jgi:hypothetical protein
LTIHAYASCYDVGSTPEVALARIDALIEHLSAQSVASEIESKKRSLSTDRAILGVGVPAVIAASTGLAWLLQAPLHYGFFAGALLGALSLALTNVFERKSKDKSSTSQSSGDSNAVEEGIEWLKARRQAIKEQVASKKVSSK